MARQFGLGPAAGQVALGPYQTSCRFSSPAGPMAVDWLAFSAQYQIATSVVAIGRISYDCIAK
jgi:hypothetical protein